jgi:ribosome-associated protein
MAAVSSRPTLPTPEGVMALVGQSLDDDQAVGVVVIDLAGKSSMADYLVIGSGRSTRHVGAMAEHLRERLKAAGLPGVELEGVPHCDWVLIDGGDVIVHLFRPEIRAFYNLEKMWGVEAPSLEAPSLEAPSLEAPSLEADDSDEDDFEEDDSEDEESEDRDSEYEESEEDDSEDEESEGGAFEEDDSEDGEIEEEDPEDDHVVGGDNAEDDDIGDDGSEEDEFEEEDPEADDSEEADPEKSK